MKNKTALEFFTGLSNSEKATFVARLASNLTVVARDTYEVGTENVVNAPRLRQFNEILHRVTDQEVGLLTGEPNYPDDVFVQIVLDQDDPEVQKLTDWAFSTAAKSHAKLQGSQFMLKTA
ncbi:MAG TPA: hypothetical protein VKX17_08770 [Planctomycetota bacterium]|nr:hypothetical protein [Planctomycetota bacterium]